ncbi:MAG: sigma-70 family RNA polymerase sigma factor [Rhodothermales bacterium]
MTAEPHRELVDHLFRQEQGKMVAVLTRIFGFDQLELVEDVVQDAFLSALRAWRTRLPDNPGGWLMQAAKHRAVDLLRRGQLQIRHAATQDPAAVAVGVNELFHASEISDSQLRLMFACCHPVLEERDQLAFTLQLASGFGVREIAAALLTRQETIKKRLQRARSRIKEAGVRLAIPAGPELKARLDAVLKVLYLTFNEGYQSSTAEEVIRRDLCAEAMRLTKLVCEHPVTDTTDANALLALMCYHAARFDSRLGPDNETVLLADQDRSKWDRELIGVAHFYLSRSRPDEAPSVYVLEAAIAAQHVVAPAYADTSWATLLTLYDLLLRIKPTHTVRMNRAVVLGEMGDGPAALVALRALDPKELAGHEHLYHCVVARVYERMGDEPSRREHLALALAAAVHERDRALIRSRLASSIP